MRTVTVDTDQRLIEAMLEPPPLEQARGSLEFWRRRRSGLPFYRRSERREAEEMIRRWHERVQAAERRRYGSGLLGLVRRLIAGDTPVWSWSALGVAAVIRAVVPGRLLAITAAVAACWLLVCLLTMVALARLLV